MLKVRNAAAEQKGKTGINTDALLLSGPEVCRRLDIGLSHLHALRRAGKFPLIPVRLGRSVRWSADELTRWCAAGCPATDRWRAMNVTRQNV
jgi:predicted DNA-binding transcriptional regulator AlpA